MSRLSGARRLDGDKVLMELARRMARQALAEDMEQSAHAIAEKKQSTGNSREKY